MNKYSIINFVKKNKFNIVISFIVTISSLFAQETIEIVPEHVININGDCDICEFSCLTYELIAYEDEYKIIY